MKLNSHRILWSQILKSVSVDPWLLGLSGSLVPIPMHKSDLWRRGFNPAEDFVEFLEQKGFHQGLRSSFIKIKGSSPQKQLSLKERVQNLKGCFEWRSREKPPARIILIDDVWTTGATLSEAARTLRAAGSSEVFAWTLFRTPRRTSFSTTTKKRAETL